MWVWEGPSAQVLEFGSQPEEANGLLRDRAPAGDQVAHDGIVVERSPDRSRVSGIALSAAISFLLRSIPTSRNPCALPGSRASSSRSSHQRSANGSASYPTRRPSHAKAGITTPGNPASRIALGVAYSTTASWRMGV